MTENSAQEGAQDNAVDDSQTSTAETDNTSDSATRDEDVQEQKSGGKDQATEEKKYTQQELDAQAAKMRAIMTRRKNQEIEAVRQQAVEEAKKQTNQNLNNNSGAGNNVPQQVFDQNLNRYIPNDLTVAEYQQLANQVTTNPAMIDQYLAQRQQQKSAQNKNFDNNVSTPQTATDPQPSNDLRNQFDDCCVKLPDDFEYTITQSPYVTIDLLESAATESKGLEIVYNLQKTDPSELARIAQLPTRKLQERAIWRHATEASRPAKTVSNVKPQSPPLKGNGQISKGLKDMSYEEKKRHYEEMEYGG